MAEIMHHHTHCVITNIAFDMVEQRAKFTQMFWHATNPM